VEFVDLTCIRLADDATRADLFDDDALQRLLSAGYDIDAMPVEPPYNPVFDDLRLGYAVPDAAVLEGGMTQLRAERWEARFHVTGLSQGARTRVDALWRGSVIARTAAPAGRIERVATAWPDPAGLDREIEADLGSLPADATELERERRTRLLARIRSGLGDPGAFPDVVLDRWLAEEGAATVGDLIDRLGADRAPAAVQVAISDVTAAPTPLALPVVVAVLIRDAGFSVAELLAESQSLREQLEPLGLERAADARLPLLRPLLVAWLVPAAIFDDHGWPGADAAGRRVAAGRWLARQGIGLVPIEAAP
jgi:hypothetical protein